MMSKLLFICGLLGIVMGDSPLRNGYAPPSKDNIFNGGINGAINGGYSAPPVVNGNNDLSANGNGNGNGVYGGFGEEQTIEALAANIPGGGVPGNDFPILSEVLETGFTCEQQRFPGYYADTVPEARCQVFHICQDRGEAGMQKDSFLCPNGSIFNQQFFVCDWWFNVDCSRSEEFYSLNQFIGLEEGQQNGYGNGALNGKGRNESRYGNGAVNENGRNGNDINNGNGRNEFVNGLVNGATNGNGRNGYSNGAANGNERNRNGVTNGNRRNGYGNGAANDSRTNRISNSNKINGYGSGAANGNGINEYSNDASNGNGRNGYGNGAANGNERNGYSNSAVNGNGRNGNGFANGAANGNGSPSSGYNY